MDNTIVIATGKVHMDASGIVFVENAATREQTIDDARECLRAVKQASLGTRRPLLVDLTIAAKQTPECQRLYASPEAAEQVTAVALVTPSMLGRVMGNIAIGLSTTSIPLKLFNSVADAHRWLMDYRL